MTVSIEGTAGEGACYAYCISYAFFLHIFHCSDSETGRWAERTFGMTPCGYPHELYKTQSHTCYGCNSHSRRALPYGLANSAEYLRWEFKQNLCGWVHAYTWSHFTLSEITYCLLCDWFLAWVQFDMQLVKHLLLRYLSCCEQLALHKGIHSEAWIPGIPVNLHWQHAYKEGAGRSSWNWVLAATEAATHQPTDGPLLAHMLSFACLECPFVFV